MPFLLLAAALAFDTYRRTNLDIEEATRVSQRTAERVAAQTAAFLAASEQMLKVVATRPQVRALDRGACDPLLDDLRRLQPAYANALTLDADGLLVCSGVQPRPGAAPGPDPKYYLDEVRRTRQFTVGKPARGFATGRWVCTLAYPLAGDDGVLRGVVGLSVDLANFHSLVSTPRPPPGMVVGILNGDGVLIAVSEGGADRIGLPQQSAAAREILRQRSGSARLTGFGGIDRFYSFIPIPGSDWIAVAGMEAGTVLAPMKRAAMLRLMLLATTLGALLALVLLMKRRLQQPLEALAATVRAVRDGSLERRAEPRGAREVVDIATEFNAMLDARGRMDAELRESERRHREMLDNVDLACTMLDREGRVIYCNDFFLRRTGWTREEVLGRDWFETFVPDDRAARRERYRRSIAEGTVPSRIDTELLTRSGAKLRVHWNLMLLRSPAGDVIGNAAIGEDITDREQAFAALRMREERYRALAESSPDAILIHQDMRIVFANQAFVALMRARDAAALVGKSATSVIKPEFEASVRERIAALYAGKALPRAEQVYVRLDGSTVPVEIAAAPLLFEGRPAAQVTVRDITERVRERALVTGQAGIMERIAAGAPLAETLQAIVSFIEADAADMLASILLLDEDGVHVRHGAAGRLPEAYWRAIDGQPIGPRAGSCGTAMHRGEQVVVTDIAADPLWEDYRAVAAAHGLRACWSTPIVDAQRRVLGSFALYFHQPGRPNERDQQLIRMATHTAAIAIAKDRSEKERERLVDDLGERVKEVTLLHEVARLLQGERTMSGSFLGELAALLPSGWRFPGKCAARIAYGGSEATGPGWRPTPWILAARFATGDGRQGVVEVAYLEEQPAADIGPFLASEQDLLRSIADMLGSHLERDRAQTALRDSESVFRAVFENAAIGMTMTDPQGKLVRCNPAFCRMLGYSAAELAGRPFAELTHPDDIEQNQRLYRALVAGEIDHFQMEKRYRRKDGGIVWVQINVAQVAAGEGVAPFTIGMMEDITARHAAQEALSESEGRYRGILESMADGFLALDREWRITYVNPRGLEVTGRRAEELAGRTLYEAFPEVAGTSFDDDYRKAMHERQVAQGEHFFEPWQRWFEVRAEPTPEGISIFFRDTTERKKSESRIEYLATHDGLTGLPNRNLMQDRVTQAIAHARRAERETAVLYLNLDRFKVINDAYGHPFGDAVLKEAGARLAGMVREGDTVARHGGDAFLVLLSDLRQSADAYVVAQKILDAFARPFALEGQEVFVSASVGVSTFPQDGQTAEALLGNAEAAMYRAKELGRNTYQFFTRDMSEQTHRRVEIETALRSAVARNELHLAYQPKVDLASGRIIGCEALLRWNHPQLGAVSPARFIPVAEDSGLIVPIGDWVLRTACAQARAWQAASLPPVTVSVNLSARQFLQQDVVAWVSQVLRETGMPAERLELELTESMIAQDAEKAIATVQRLKSLGVRLAIDDFGTGYSNLSQLKRFRVDALKIDQSFVRALDSDVDDATIVLAVITLAHNLRMSAVAEGVETEAQWRFLRLNRCDAMQGYYFSKPVPAAEMQAMLAEGRKLHNAVKP